MPSVYDDNDAGFSRRVNYAAQCFMRGTNETRHFDTCFEMYDGDLVVTALVRRARKNPSLYNAIAGQWRGTFPQHWLDTAQKHASIPTRKLRDAARVCREEANARSLERLTAIVREANPQLS